MRKWPFLGVNDYFLGKCSLIVGDDQFWGISTPFWGVNDHYLGWVITLGSTDRVFGILLQIHQKILAWVRPPPPFWQCQDFHCSYYRTPSLRDASASKNAITIFQRYFEKQVVLKGGVVPEHKLSKSWHCRPCQKGGLTHAKIFWWIWHSAQRAPQSDNSTQKVIIYLQKVSTYPPK